VSTGDGEGLRWVADPPAGVVEPEDEEQHVAGTVIRFMWDYGCDVPLWDEDGPLLEDPDWLAAELGLSGELVRDLVAWAAHYEDAAGGREHPHEAERLFARLQSEVPARFTLRNRESRTH
jgi:hypothetical protein